VEVGEGMCNILKKKAVDETYMGGKW